MPEQTQTRYQLQTREYQFRAESIDNERGIISGIAVPYDTPVRIREWWGDEYDEQFAAGSVDDDGALAFWRHSDPIGYLATATDTTAGRQVDLQISRTALGVDALTLARDLQNGGRPMELSVGFELGGDFTVEERDDDVPLVTRTRVRVREISLVPFGAYAEGAAVSAVRHQAPPTPPEGESPMPDTLTREDLESSLLTQRQDLERSFDARLAALQPTTSPAVDTRSAAEVLKAIVAGDESTIREYNELLERAYGGSTTADTVVKDGWVGDLTRIFDATNGTIASFFSTGALPSTGLNLEYGQLKSNTTQVTEQENEGDDLATGKVQLETKTAAIKTYGGYVELTRQEIERSTLPILNRSLEAMARAAGGRAKVVARTAYTTLKTAREAITSNGGVVVLGATLAAGTISNWIGSTIDAAIKLEAEDLQIDGLITSSTVFKKLASLTYTDGRPAFLMDGPGVNNVGTLKVTGLGGQIVGVRVLCDTGLSGDSAAFANVEALRSYQSSLVQLQDENVINLSKQFSVYRYGAVAAEIPAGLVPVKLAAS